MKIKQAKLTDELIAETNQMTAKIEKLKTLPVLALNYKPTARSWSVLECLEHLNLYGDFYLKEIEDRILQSSAKPAEYFRSGFLGNYFAESMLPKNGKINKMKTFKDKNPANSALTVTTVDRFLKQQNRMKELLIAAKKTDLNKVKTSITIPAIKLKLGDTFRFVIFHNMRHMLQIDKILSDYQSR